MKRCLMDSCSSRQSARKKSFRARINQKKATKDQLRLLERFIKYGKIAFYESGIAERLNKELFPGIGYSRKDDPMLWGNFKQMLIFLWLAQICPNSRRISPHERIDKIWHLFIIFTKDYTKFCKRTVGHYIHHVPFTQKNRGKYVGRKQWFSSWEQIDEFMGPDRSIIIPNMWLEDVALTPTTKTPTTNKSCTSLRCCNDDSDRNCSS